MEDNPYTAFLETIRREGSSKLPGVVLGKVLSAEPIKVLAEGNTLERGDLLVSADLAGEPADVAAELEGTGSIVGAMTSLSGDLRMEAEGTVTRQRPLRAGDLVLLFPVEERQRYVLVCKVVTP